MNSVKQNIFISAYLLMKSTSRTVRPVSTTFLTALYFEEVLGLTSKIYVSNNRTYY
jgi:hypothetical protein